MPKNGMMASDKGCRTMPPVMKSGSGNGVKKGAMKRQMMNYGGTPGKRSNRKNMY